MLWLWLWLAHSSIYLPNTAGARALICIPTFSRGFASDLTRPTMPNLDAA